MAATTSSDIPSKCILTEGPGKSIGVHDSRLYSCAIMKTITKVTHNNRTNDCNVMIDTRAYRKAGYLTMAIAGYIPANSQLAAAIATIVKSLSIGK